MEQQHMTKRTNSNPLCNNLFEEDSATVNITSISTPMQPQSPPRISFKSHHPQIISYDHHHDNLLYSPSRSSTAATSPQPPPSPDSPWTLSPHHTPSPSLLHHCIASLHRHDGVIHSIAVAKGLVFTGSDSSRVRAWRQPDCTERGCFKSTHGEVRAILARGNTLFTSHKDRRVRVWNITAAPENFHAKKITHLPRNWSLFKFPSSTGRRRDNKHKDSISCMAYNHAEGLLYTGSYDRTVKVWRISDSRCVDTIAAHEDQVNAVVVNQDDGCVFTCSSDGSIKIWRRVYGQSSHTLTMTLKFQPSPVNALAISSSPPNSCFLYSGSSDGFINFWEKEKMSGRYNHGGFLQGHRFSVLCLVAIEKLLFSGSEDTTIRVWRREEGSCFHECLAVLDAHRGPVKCLEATLEIEKVVVMGFLVYSCGLDQTFKVWRIKVLPEEKGGPHLQVGGSNYTSTEHRHRRGGGVEPIDTTQVKIAEYEMSPVLSPSWVEKKLQGDHSSNPFH